MKKRWLAALLCAVLGISLAIPPAAAGEEARTLTLADYRDKMRAGWLGKMVGVSAGILSEFHYRGEIAPESVVPRWDGTLLSLGAAEDDIYLPFVLLQQMDAQGVGISAREMAIALYPYSFEFWNGHYTTFEFGIAPPDAGHPAYAPFPDGLSYSFAADYSGLIAPGCPAIPVELADRFASMLVYGDGIYGGAYIGALYSEAFFSQDMEQVVRTALTATPEESWLHEAIADTLACYEADPADWEAAWRFITQKYFLRADYNWIQWPYGGRTGGIDLDSKLNCAYATIALLYGGGDIERTLSLAIRCGQDADSNAANALGVLMTSKGWDAVPDAYKQGLSSLPKIRYANATFEALVEVTERVALAALDQAGAAVDEAGGVLTIPAIPLEIPQVQNSKKPGALADSLFSAQEMARMGKPALQDGGFEADWHTELYPPWMFSGNGSGGIDLRQGKARTGANNAWLSALPSLEVALSQHRIFVEPQARYTLSCSVRSSANFEGVELSAHVSGEGGAKLGGVQLPASAQYETIEWTFETGDASVIDVRIGYTGGAEKSWLQIDDVTLMRAQ